MTDKVGERAELSSGLVDALQVPLLICDAFQSHESGFLACFAYFLSKHVERLLRTAFYVFHL